MKLLAIDTTEAACSAALLIDGQVNETFDIVPRRHSELILPMIDGLLHDAGMTPADLDVLAFARGPGSFTGVRIAAAVIQGIATATGLRVVPVSSLLALAQGAIREHGVTKVLAGFDARMKEVYWAVCEADQDGRARLIDEEIVCAPESVPLPNGTDWYGLGSAWAGYPDALAARLKGSLSGCDANAMVHAQDVARLAAAEFAAGNAVKAEQALPVYLRDQVAKKMRQG
jgi:tRNA threonylcarbamoyladenosine biosynthesis protein TsaB